MTEEKISELKKRVEEQRKALNSLASSLKAEKPILLHTV